MKAVIGFLNKRIKLSEKAGKAVGIVFSMLFAVSLAVFCYLSLKMDMVLCVVLLLVTGVPLIVFRLWRTIFNNTILIHCLIIFFDYLIGSRIVDIEYENAPEIVIVITAACTAVFFSFFEILIGVLMEFSGGETHAENFPKAILYSLPLFFIAAVYVPSETYFNNFANYSYIYSDFFPYLLIKTLIMTLITAVFLCGMSEKAFTGSTRLICGLTLAVYAQYMFMNSSMPRTLGDPMDWDALAGECIINSIIWVCIILLPIIAGLIIDRIPKLKDNSGVKNAHNYVSMFVGGIHIVTLITLMITTPVDIFDYSIVGLSNEEQFVVSKNKNIITIIIDMADQDYFAEAYETTPEKFECLKDFTYYTNACMMYDSTYLSVPQMFTGAEEYPDNFASEEWKRDVWNSERSTEFYSRLHDNGYKANIYGDFANDYTELNGNFDNTIQINKEEVIIYKPLLYGTIDMFSRFRYMPLAIKRYFEEDMAFYWCDGVSVPQKSIMDNKIYFNALDLAVSETDKNYFIVEHLIGTHGLIGTLEQETQDCLDVINKYISQLKELGVYDDSVILITADHGEHDKDRNFPIFYLKEPGETHSETLYNNAPVWFTDLLATYLKASGMWRDGDEKIFGRAAQDIPEDEVRERTVFQRVEYNIGESGHLLPVPGIMYGYTFTGDKYALAEREHSAPPDKEIKISIYDMA